MTWEMQRCLYINVLNAQKTKVYGYERLKLALDYILYYLNYSIDNIDSNQSNY